MAQNDYFLIAHILLTLGILGYVSDNTYLAYICLSISLVFFARQLLENHMVKKVETVNSPEKEQESSSPIQTISEEPIITNNKEGVSL